MDMEAAIILLICALVLIGFIVGLSISRKD
jgi:hypothetical protein